jgi:hypothetical protein
MTETMLKSTWLLASGVRAVARETSSAPRHAERAGRAGTGVDDGAPGPSMSIRLQCPNGPVVFAGYAGLLHAGD